MLSPEEIRDILKRVQEPELHKDIVSLQMVKNISVENSQIKITVELTTPACPLKDEIKNRILSEIKNKTGETHVLVEFTSRVLSARPVTAKAPIEGVKNIIAVYACKGGVGKSTVATNLACALMRRGAQVGLLDADIHGPNIPLMMGAHGKAYVSGDNKISPVIAHDVKTMSLAYVMDENAPKIWRGPMVHGAIQQMLRDTVWGEIDYLIVDLPPGTGDAQLTIIQSVPLSGVIFVSTPQTVSLLDGAKGIQMFQKLNVPVLGLIENMAGFECPHCHTTTNIFSKGGAEKEAERFGIPFLGALPLDPDVVQGGDHGSPLVLSNEKSATSQLIYRMAEQVAARISVNLFSENETVVAH